MRKIFVRYIVSIAILVLSIWLGISIGSVKIPISTLWNAGADATATNILWKIRMPRVVLAGLVGASLAISGAAFQGLLKIRSLIHIPSGVIGASVGAVMTLFFWYFHPVFRHLHVSCIQHDWRCTYMFLVTWICPS